MASVTDPSQSKTWNSVIDYGREKIIVRRGEISRVIAGLQSQWAPKASKFVILTDKNVWKIWGSKIETDFNATGLTYFVYVMPPGEEVKTRQTKEKIEDYMMSKRCGRDTCLLGTHTSFETFSRLSSS